MTVPPPSAPAQLQSEALQTVLRVLAEILPDRQPPDATAPLLGIPGFDSLAVAALVEGLETALGHDLPDELIVPESFETAARVASVVVAPLLAEPLRGGPNRSLAVPSTNRGENAC